MITAVSLCFAFLPAFRKLAFEL